ncbi:hypothetical protein ES288_D09G081100v1 [Gossypium darwinii]|uniref:Uncharacterized protein n=1 Tax=Gossypium darwinii TaxID=34276 RepID=A0A5D2B9X0_GOSDA|nr:hypothetical protein ES288_D09G081100v1 [Gossypium darwinii]
MVDSQPLDTKGVFGGNLGESPTLTTVHPPVQVQDTIITAWTIRHPTHNRNDLIARVELYQLRYIPRAKWSIHEGVRCFFYSFPWCSWAILDLN